VAVVQVTSSAVSVAVSHLASTANSSRLDGWSLLLALLNVEWRGDADRSASAHCIPASLNPGSTTSWKHHSLSCVRLHSPKRGWSKVVPFSKTSLQCTGDAFVTNVVNHFKSSTGTPLAVPLHLPLPSCVQSFYNYHNSGHYPPSCLLLKIQLNSIGLSVPHKKHNTSSLRAQQVNTIYRFVTMV
jgi:hypothetical protein